MDLNVATILKGVGFHCQQNTKTKAHKAAKKGARDSLHKSTVAIEATEGTLSPLTTALTFQAPPLMIGLNINPCNRVRAQIKEELAMIDMSARPWGYKELAWASMHFVSFDFCEEMQQCSQMKLLKCIKRNNNHINVFA